MTGTYFLIQKKYNVRLYPACVEYIHLMQYNPFADIFGKWFVHCFKGERGREIWQNLTEKYLILVGVLKYSKQKHLRKKNNHMWTWIRISFFRIDRSFLFFIFYLSSLAEDG